MYKVHKVQFMHGAPASSIFFFSIALFRSLVKCSANTCRLKSIGPSSTFQTNLLTSHQLPSSIILTQRKVVQSLPPTEPNPANHV